METVLYIIKRVPTLWKGPLYSICFHLENKYLAQITDRGLVLNTPIMVAH